MSILLRDGLMLNMMLDSDTGLWAVQVSLLGYSATRSGFPSTSTAYSWAQAQVDRIFKDAA